MSKTERTELTPKDVHALMVGLNRVEQFPVSLSTLTELCGVNLGHHLELAGYMRATVGDMTLVLRGTPRLRDDRSICDVEFTEISIEGTGDSFSTAVEPPGAIATDVGTYAYLPTAENTEQLGGWYRSLTTKRRKEGEVARLETWTYRVDQKRRGFVSQTEREELSCVVMDLLGALREDRFVEAYEAFVAAYPPTEFGFHQLAAFTVVIRFFDDRSETYAKAFLKESGLTAYAGIHITRVAGGEFRYPHPELFHFFGIEALDATALYKGKPYNRGGTGYEPLADVTRVLPNISAAGHRDGGLAYYVYLEHRDDGWTFECPGFYPHDGKTVPRLLDPALLQFPGFVVTHSRPLCPS